MKDYDNDERARIMLGFNDSRKVSVSIIVPVYNAEKSLERCVDSILNQEYTDIELILVNDGSKDSSKEICDSYARKDKRVKVIHKENSGVSDTRNCGIEAAIGDYLQFVDADDWVSPEATKLMVREARERNCELVVADFYRVIGNRVSHKGSIKEEKVMSRTEFAEYMMENPADFYYGVLWNKLYSREIITKYNICMDTKVNWCEDFMFNLEYLLHVDNVYALQMPVYYYIKTEGSLVNQSMDISTVVRTKLQVFKYYNSFYKDVYDEKDYAKKRLSIYRYLIDIANDDLVEPPFMSNSKKLGEERVLVAEGVVNESNYLSENYRSSKLLDRYYEAIGIRYELSMKEIKVLAYLCYAGEINSKKELADCTGFQMSSVNHSLQKLENRKMIEISKNKKRLYINILGAGYLVVEEIKKAIRDYDSIRFQGFTESEIGQYLKFQMRIEENMNRVLK